VVVNDELQPFDLNPDPLLEELSGYGGRIQIGTKDKKVAHSRFYPTNRFLALIYVRLDYQV